MNDVKLREATPDDIGLLVQMMTEFYAEAGYPLDATRASAAFSDLQRSPMLGRAFLIRAFEVDVGYIVLTLTFSMEYGGLTACVDDFYIRASDRGQGAGGAAMHQMRQIAESLGVRAIHLEVGRDNDVAQAVYRKAGFVDNDRQLLTLTLASRTHE